MDTQRANAVFAGGGVRGIAFVGAVSIFEEAGYEWQYLAGTSAGAVVASLLAAGYKAQELRQLMSEVDFQHFAIREEVAKFPVIGPLLSLLGLWGIYSAEGLERWLAERLAARGVHTFGDLRVSSGLLGSTFAYRLQVIAADVTRHQLLVLPRDAPQLGMQPDTLSVALAVRMSSTIPVFYVPVRVKRDSNDIVVVDGGLISNYPVWLFDSASDPAWPTIGFRLVDTPGPTAYAPPQTFFEFLAALVETSIQAGEQRDLQAADAVRTVNIPTLGVKATDFSLSQDTLTKLYESGRSSAQQFLAHRDFAHYVRLRRRTEPTALTPSTEVTVQTHSPTSGPSQIPAEGGRP
ncbi:MAG: patatin-like phospholipase family protein [Limnochordaceae bacterium]|nr:patatin-like phospholipase family protein [Limnochordaceae bacterium]